ncbi:MAG: SEC-C domain-containing protein, partial [Caldilineaceae bacterium]|nr:SEC-C domain-containing protein [Caldilineaceae bacterium]
VQIQSQQQQAMPTPIARNIRTNRDGGGNGGNGKPQTVRNTGPQLSRNDPCWCGSGKKYKQCHMKSDRANGGAPAARQKVKA